MALSTRATEIETGCRALRQVTLRRERAVRTLQYKTINFAAVARSYRIASHRIRLGHSVKMKNIFKSRPPTQSKWWPKEDERVALKDKNVPDGT